MRAWLEQPHGRRHKALPKPCALATKALHTCEYIYITSPQCHSQASSNLVEMSSSHAHKFIAANFIGKAMRVTNPSDGSVFNKTVGQSPFFTNITAAFVNTLIFELRGSRGRPLPYEPPSRDTKATLEAHSGDDQVRDGNTAVGMTLLLEKFVGTAPQKLQVTRIPSTQPTTESGYEEQFNNP